MNITKRIVVKVYKKFLMSTVKRDPKKQLLLTLVLSSLLSGVFSISKSVFLEHLSYFHRSKNAAACFWTKITC